MCGICGIIQPVGVDREQLERITRGMLHRGPDAGGTWISPDGQVGFGHRRLTIIDLDPRSNQPFHSDDDQLVLTFNGEIFNFHDIRRELEAKGHRFRTTSDTEVILHAYAEWDTASVHKFRGMFAFALWDARRKRVWIARDRLGIKPVIYYEKDGVFAFASELPPLSDETAFDRTLDMEALYDALTYLYIPSPKTAFRHIRKLEAGHELLLENGAITIRKYWDVPEIGTREITEAQAVERLRELIDESVRLRLLADVPVGSLLSGGIDSSVVTTYAQRNASGPLNTFSVGFDVAEKDELAFANALAAELGSAHTTEVLTVGGGREQMQQCMFSYGEPHGDSSIIPTTLVSRMARQKVTVALSGDGGDEVFWGYKRYLAYPEFNQKDGLPLRTTLGNLVQTALPLETRGRHRLLQHCLKDFDLYTLLLGGLTRADKRALLTPEIYDSFRDYDEYWAYRKFWREDLPLASRLQYLDLKTYLPDDILTKVDRASMTVALEARVPLLDHKLVEEVFSWPDTIRSDGRTLKYLFKKAMHGVIPERVLTKPKHGFSIPWRAWAGQWAEQDAPQGDGHFFQKGLRLPNNYMLFVTQRWLEARGR
jgi:asparagine synthase (glutamine-hydrolysing)